jgi:hypothetical protein
MYEHEDSKVPLTKWEASPDSSYMQSISNQQQSLISRWVNSLFSEMIVYKGTSGEVTLKVLPLILITLIIFGAMSLMLKCKNGQQNPFSGIFGRRIGSENRSPHSRRFYFMRRDGYAN